MVASSAAGLCKTPNALLRQVARPWNDRTTPYASLSRDGLLSTRYIFTSYCELQALVRSGLVRVSLGRGCMYRCLRCIAVSLVRGQRARRVTLRRPFGAQNKKPAGISVDSTHGNTVRCTGTWYMTVDSNCHEEPFRVSTCSYKVAASGHHG